MVRMVDKQIWERSTMTEYGGDRKIHYNKLADKEFVFSEEYKTILDRRWDSHQKDFNDRIGAWRWDGIYEHRQLVASHVFDPDQVGIDFGGYQGPIGGYTKVIDIACNNSLDDLEDNSIDYIFTCHCLEHIKDVKPIVATMFKKIKNGGKLIVLVPSFTKEVWRAYYAPDHEITFKLRDSFLTHYLVPNDASYEEILIDVDTMLEDAGFDIIIAKKTRNHCIFLYAEKNLIYISGDGNGKSM